MGRNGVKNLLNYNSIPVHLRGCLLENVRKHYARELEESLQADYHAARNLALNEILMQQHHEGQMLMGLHHSSRSSRWRDSGMTSSPPQPSPYGQFSTFLMSSAERPSSSSSDMGVFLRNSRGPAAQEPLLPGSASVPPSAASASTTTTTTTTVGTGIGATTTTTTTNRGAGTQLIVTVERSMHRMGGEGVGSDDAGASREDYSELADSILGAWQSLMTMRPRQQQQQQQNPPVINQVPLVPSPIQVTNDLDVAPYVGSLPPLRSIPAAGVGPNEDGSSHPQHQQQPGPLIVLDDDDGEDDQQQPGPLIVLDDDDGEDDDSNGADGARGATRVGGTSYVPSPLPSQHPVMTAAVPMVLPRLMSAHPVAGLDRAQVVRSSDAVTLIVYIYCRGVQSWDISASAAGGNVSGGWMPSMMMGSDAIPSELVSWHIKGLEYDLGRVSAQGEGGSEEALFEMSQEQVRIRQVHIK